MRSCANNLSKNHRTVPLFLSLLSPNNLSKGHRGRICDLSLYGARILYHRLQKRVFCFPLIRLLPLQRELSWDPSFLSLCTIEVKCLFRERARLRARARIRCILDACKLNRARARKRARSRNMNLKNVFHLRFSSSYTKTDVKIFWDLLSG
jgi:hypothetical protein